jgi:ABC-type lipoprotein release transport system permease subunit
MTAILMWVRAGLRERWRAWVGMALLIGLFGGAVLALAAGARRTDSAYQRFLVSSDAWDAAIFYMAWTPAFAELDPDDVEELPSVSDSIRVSLYLSDEPALSPMALGSGLGERFAFPKVLEGRLPEAVDEVSVPVGTAQFYRLSVGSSFEIPFLKGGRKRPSDVKMPMSFRVVGVHVAAGLGEFPPGATDEQGTTILSAAFDETHRDDLANLEAGLIKLHGGVDAVPRFTEEIEPFSGGKPYFVLPQSDQTGIADEAVHLIAIALWVLAAGLAFVAALSLGQTLARQFFIEGERYPIGRALGLSGSQLFAIGMMRAVLIGGIAAITAVLLAFLLSPLMPFGIARIVEPAPGFSIDIATFTLGALAVLLAVIVLSVIPAWRAERIVAVNDRRPQRRSRAAHLAFRAGLPAPAVAGIRLALEQGRGVTAVPIRSTLGAATVAIAALMVAFTFAASLDRLLHTPHDYGITWQLEVETAERSESPPEITRASEEVAARTRALDGVVDASVSDYGIPFAVDGVGAAGIAMNPGHPHLALPLREGRHPAAVDEIALGARTLEAIGKRVGDTISVEMAGVGAESFTVVGVVAVPGFDTAAGLGEGSVVTYAALNRFLDELPPVTTVFVRVAEGADLAEVRTKVAAVDGVRSVDTPDRPEDLRNLGRIERLPLVLAGILALLAATAIAHGSASSVRRRGRDLAIFRALGFVRRQIRATVAWQALTYVVAALLLGVPLGIAAGRWLWATAATELAVTTPAAVPILVLTAVPVGAALVAVAVSALPARIAARTRPATILRAP